MKKLRIFFIGTYLVKEKISTFAVRKRYPGYRPDASCAFTREQHINPIFLLINYDKNRY